MYFTPKPIKNYPALRRDIEHVYVVPGKQKEANEMIAKQRMVSAGVGNLHKHDAFVRAEILRQEFIDRTNKKSENNSVQRMVNYAQHALDTELNNKRNRLTDMLASEERNYELEFMQKIKNTFDETLKTREQNLFQLKMQRERQNEEFVKQKKIQQLLNSCDEIRPYLRERLLKDSKVCQLAQINDKRKMDMEKEDIENLWLEVAGRRNDKWLEREHQHKQFRIQNAACVAKQLKTQIAHNMEEHEQEKQLDLDERIRQDVLLKNLKLEEERLAKRKHDKRTQITADLKAQLQLAEKCRKITEQNDANFEKIFHDQTMKEIENEKNAISDASSALKTETLRYLEYLKQQKLNRAQEDKKKEIFIDEVSRNIACENYKKIKGYKEKRDNLAKETFSTLRQQIHDRNVQRKKEAEDEYCEAVRERCRILNDLAKNDKKEKQKKQNAIQYGLELKKQAELTKQQNELNKKLEIECFEKSCKVDMDCKELIQNYVKGNIDILPLHPNLHLMKIL